MNVALHLTQMGKHAKLLSKIGNDQLGTSLKAFIDSYGGSTDLLQVDSYHDTGLVSVDNSDNQNVKYTIEEPSAWDFIDYHREVMEQMTSKDLFVYGSLSSRNDHSCDSLLRYLESAAFKVMDVNLRQPHFEISRLEILMRKANLLKINDDELTFFSDQYVLNENDIVEYLIEKFELEGVLVTMGGDGARVNLNGIQCHVLGNAVEVVDTVGSGDAFLAGFLSKMIDGCSIIESLEFGCSMGGFIAGKQGANPKYSKDEINEFVA